LSGAAIAAFGLAAASAVALNWAYFAQHREASQLPPLRLRRPVASLRLLFENRRWLAGFGVGVAGWVLYVAALRFGSLSLVQAASAGGIGVLALLVRAGGTRLSGRERSGIAFSIVGLALLALSLSSSSALHPFAHHGSAAGVAAWMTVSAVVATACALRGGHVLTAGAGLGLAAGLCYAAGDVGTKAAVGGGVLLLFGVPVLAAHGLGFVYLQLGFQRGSALSTAGVATLFTNAVPIAAGMILFGDGIPGGVLGAARVVSFAAVVVGAVLLTRAAPPAPPAVVVASAR
jgi:hypothetical protein